METEAGKALGHKLTQMRRFVRTTQIVGGVFWCIGLTALLCLLCFQWDQASGGMSVNARYGWRWTAGIALTLALMLTLLRPLLRRLSASDLAAQVETKYPVLQERLLTAVDLTPALQGADGSQFGFSRPMASALIRETQEASRLLDFRRAVQLKPLRNAFAVAVLSSLALSVSAARSPEAFANWMRRMANPAADIAPWAGTRVWVTPQKFLLPKNSSVTLTVATLGNRAESCTLYYRPEGDTATPPKSILLKSPKSLSPAEAKKLQGANVQLASNEKSVPDGAKFTVTLPNLTQHTVIYAVANDGRSNERRIQVEERPTLLGVRMKPICTAPTKFCRKQRERLPRPSVHGSNSPAKPTSP
jgi:hypothetical protein